MESYKLFRDELHRYDGWWMMPVFTAVGHTFEAGMIVEVSGWFVITSSTSSTFTVRERTRWERLLRVLRAPFYYLQTWWWEFELRCWQFRDWLTR